MDAFTASIWGLICVMSSAEIQQIKDLMAENAELKQQIEELKQLLKNDSVTGSCHCTQLILTHEQELEFYNLKEDSNLKTSLVPMLNGCLNTLYKNWFITITFSPKKFIDISPNTADQQKTFILYHLLKLHEMGLYEFAYGCMEYFETGIVHSHVIIQTYNIILVQEYLNEVFNHSKRNKHCIDVRPAHQTGALNYVNKSQETGKERGDLFYQIGDKTPHYFTNIVATEQKDNIEARLKIAQDILNKKLPIPEYKK